MSRRPSHNPRRESDAESLRLQAYLARAGVASRRACEDLIRDGRVRVNGRVAELGSKVIPGRDRVELDGREVRLQRLLWLALHKPTGYVTTREDPQGRKTVYDLLPSEYHHLFHVGRLDRDSSGLLLLTNDGETANRLMHPRYGVTKEYLVDIEGEPSVKQLRRLVEGVELEDGMAHAEEVELRDEVRAGVFRIALVMQEGRRREVRRMLEAVGYPVKRLFRRRFGPIRIGRLPPRQWRLLSHDEVRLLKELDHRDGT